MQSPFSFRYIHRSFLSISPPAVFLALLLPVLLLVSCGPSTETIVVGTEARGPEITEEEEEVTVEREPRLAVLKIGESNRIQSMDPLFALNTATKRMIQLSYEGLVRFDHQDEIVPAAARRWQVSDDSLTWTFHLRRDLFFHDDESFAQGRGRRVNSRDVVRVFERMASRDVPSNAAELFMNTVEGFEPYYLEQREVYLSRDRQVTSISGIEATSDSTVAFRLLQPDRNFLARLASPYAVIYPSEPFRFRDDGLHRHAVGTGPFQYESSIGDSIHVFRRHAHYHARDEQDRRLPLVSRVELMNITDETRLFNHFQRGRLHAIMDAGPRTVDRIKGGEPDDQADLENTRTTTFENFRLDRLPNQDPIVLRYHTRNRFGLGRSDAASVIRHTTTERIAQDWFDPSLTITFREEDFTQSNIGRVFRRFGEDSEHRLVLAFNQDQLPRMLARVITESMDANLQRDMVQRRVFSSDIFLYLDYLQSFAPGTVHERHPEELMRIETDRYLLRDQSVEGIRTNSLSWWMDLRQVQRAKSARRPEALLDR